MTTTILQLDADELETKLEEVVGRVVSDQAADEWLTVERAADYLGMTEEALRQLIRGDRVPLHRIGERRIRLSKTELNAWVRSGAAAAA